MKNTLSSNYFFNRYSWYGYFFFHAVFIIRIKFNGWAFLMNDVKTFVLINMFYFLWLFFYGSFHFKDQSKVTRIDYETIKLVKGSKSSELKKNDIAQIYIQKIVAVTPGFNHWYKVLVITKAYEKYRFTFVAKLKNLSSTDCVESFIYESENFWGLADKNMIRQSPDIFFCN